MICLKRNHCSFGQKIVRKDKRKIFTLCIFIMAILSFVKIFQYSITYSPQWKLHMKYMGMLKSLYLGTGTLTSHLSDSGISGLSQRLASINSTQKMSGELEENHQGQNRSSINEPTATRNGTLCPINGTNLGKCSYLLRVQNGPLQLEITWLDSATLESKLRSVG